ncbi:MAG TPA: methyltransferase, TIGR04325 family [Candidatus Didemnitutus sp.]|nr:methyltransferase, TIGR04325 family [Candidatus Didemnitutus sp.]
MPTSFRRAARLAFGWRWFHGNYAAWSDARRACGSYDDSAIVERVLAATQAVRRGTAAYERDGVLFHEPAPEAGLLAALGTVAQASCAGPAVLDFGGALGTTFWRHRAALPGPPLRWDVVEQPRFVTAGRTHFAGTPVQFFASIEEAEGAAPHDVLLASTSLQYLEDPPATAGEWQRREFPWLLFNNLPLHEDGPTRLAVQQVPPEIYPASYPVWFFNRAEFLGWFAGGYEVVQEFASEAVWPVGWRYYASTGLLMRRKQS